MGGRWGSANARGECAETGIAIGRGGGTHRHVKLLQHRLRAPQALVIWDRGVSCGTSFRPWNDRAAGSGGRGRVSRVESSSVVGSLVAGSVKLRAGRVRGFPDSPQENHDLRSDLAHCALHLRDGYMITSPPLYKPRLSRLFPLQSPPPAVARSRERFRQFRAVRASPLNERLTPRSPLGRSERPRLLDALGASPSVTPISRSCPSSFAGRTCWSVYFSPNVKRRASGQPALLIRRQRVVAVATRRGEDEASRRRGASRTRPALSPAHPRADPTRDIPADRHSPVAPFFTFDAKRDSPLTVTPRLPICPPRRLRRARLATLSRRETPRWSPR